MSANPQQSQALSTVQSMEKHLSNPERKARLLALAERDGAKLERILTVAMKVVAFDEKLQRCSIDSIIQAVTNAVEIGLEPSGISGEAYLIPRKGIACLQPSYRGKAKLARENGWDIEADVIFENDHHRISKGSDPKLEHEYATGDRGEPLWFYAVATEMRTGYRKWTPMSVDEVNYIRDTWGYGEGDAWEKSYFEMGKKTVIHRLEKLLPCSPKMNRARELDVQHLNDSETVVRGRAVPANEAPSPSGSRPPDVPDGGGSAPGNGPGASEAGARGQTEAPQAPSSAPVPPSRTEPPPKKRSKLDQAREAAEAKGSACADCIPESPKNPVGVKCPKHGGASAKPKEKSALLATAEQIAKEQGSEIKDIVQRAANSGNPCTKTKGCILAEGHPPFCKGAPKGQQVMDTKPAAPPAKDEDPGPCEKTEGCSGSFGHGGGCVVPKAAEAPAGGLFGGKAEG